ncbi:hypothetical protein FSOLCH5_014621 [Fusarium solani]
MAGAIIPVRVVVCLGWLTRFGDRDCDRLGDRERERGSPGGRDCDWFGDRDCDRLGDREWIGDRGCDRLGDRERDRGSPGGRDCDWFGDRDSCARRVVIARSSENQWHGEEGCKKSEELHFAG